MWPRQPAVYLQEETKHDFYALIWIRAPFSILYCKHLQPSAPHMSNLKYCLMEL